jgi:hypothetical protein
MHYLDGPSLIIFSIALNTFTSDELYARDDRDDTLTRRNYSVVTTYLRNLEMCYAVFYLGVSRTDNCVHAILAIHSAHPAVSVNIDLLRHLHSLLTIC